MGDERRYREDEVGEIFALATSAGQRGPPTRIEHEGLTLEELQEVGREVGLAPERVVAAAATLEARAEILPRRTSFGAPVSVGRVVPLPRAATDHEWQVLVGELRATFGTRGQITSQGAVREWSTGRFHAFLEPTEGGYRLRLGAHKVGARAVTVVGAVPLVVGLLLLGIGGIAGGGTFRASLAMLFPSLLALLGGGVLTRNFLRLRRWGDERERQMDHVADRARALLAASPGEAEP